MARHEDNEAWGEDNSVYGCLMSNIVPQHRDMNGEASNDLEELHQDVVADASVGSGLSAGRSLKTPTETGLKTLKRSLETMLAFRRPRTKCWGWFDRGNVFHARGFIVRQEDRVRNNPAHYLRSIDTIEEATGLDFFPDLPTVAGYNPSRRAEIS